MARAPRRRAVDHGRSAFRRQVNEAFCSPDGSFSVSKFLAFWAQVVVLGHMGTSWDELIKLPLSLMVVLVFLIAPELIKKALIMKLGGSAT